MSNSSKNKKRVFNLVLGSDLVTYVAPESYGFYRCGTDKVLFDGETEYEEHLYSKESKYNPDSLSTTRFFTSKIDAALAKFAPDLKLPGFLIKNDIHKKDQAPALNDKYTTEKEFIDFIFETIMTTDSSGAGGYSFNTRELFVNTVQPHISYAVSIFMQDTSIIDDIKAAVSSSFTKAIEWFSTENAFFNDLKPILDSHGISYNENQLQETCNAIAKMVDLVNQKGCLSQAVTMLVIPMLGDNKDISRLINQHYPEVVYAALLQL